MVREAKEETLVKTKRTRITRKTAGDGFKRICYYVDERLVEGEVLDRFLESEKLRLMEEQLKLLSQVKNT